MTSAPSPSLPFKTDPPANFFAMYSVVLSVPLNKAYSILGTAAGHERVCRLSKLCTGFEMFEKDQVELPIPNYPEGRKISEVGVRTFSPSSPGRGEREGGMTVTRQHFTMQEDVPVLFGMFKSKVKLRGTLSWDDSVFNSDADASSAKDDSAPLEALYESIASLGIVVWKLRTFTREEGDPNKTRVTERIEGWAPILLRSIVQNATTTSHKAHMDQYHTLF